MKRNVLTVILVFALAALAVAASDNSSGWKWTVKTEWTNDSYVNIACDGPHRMYAITQAGQPSAIFVLKDGCLNWPKQPAEAR